MVASESVLHRYEQVATHVRHLIESGTYSSQEKLHAYLIHSLK